MTESQLRKFITDNDIQWCRTRENGNDEIVISLDWNSHMAYEFNRLTNNYPNYERFCSFNFKDSTLFVPMRNICEFLGIEMNNIFVGSGSYEHSLD